MRSDEGLVSKNWGYEVVWASNNLYCGKMLCFPHPGTTTSMHFHKNKTESWFVLEVSTEDDRDDTYRISPGTPAPETTDSQINT